MWQDVGYVSRINIRLYRLRGLLLPLQVPKSIWEDISLDFINGLPQSRRVDTILAVVDHLSKYGHFIGLKHLSLPPKLVRNLVKR